MSDKGEKNVDVSTLCQMIKEKTPITLETLNKMETIKITTEEEFYLILVLTNHLTLEMTKYQLAKTDKKFIDAMDESIHV